MSGQVVMTIPERACKLRSCMLVHSFIYYRLDQNIISDDKWQQWADELRDLQAEHGVNFNWYDEEFTGWGGSTGMHLPADSWTVNKAEYLLRNLNKPPQGKVVI